MWDVAHLARKGGALFLLRISTAPRNPRISSSCLNARTDVSKESTGRLGAMAYLVERLPSGQVRCPSKEETFFSAASEDLTPLQRHSPPGFQVFENEFPSCTVRTGRARKSRMASITALNSTFST